MLSEEVIERLIEQLVITSVIQARRLHRVEHVTRRSQHGRLDSFGWTTDDNDDNGR